MSNKGEYLGLCNLSSCTTEKPATYHNYGTSKYYCKECAERLNSDEYNQRDAMRMFGHDLCIEESVRPKPLNEILEQGNKTYIIDNMSYEYLNRDLMYDKPTKKQMNQVVVPVRNSADNPKIQNNEPCPCGSGNKYKKCCKKM